MPGTERDISLPTGSTRTTPHSSDPKTPRTIHIQDMLGEVNMGSIETIFKELVSMLKGLPTGGYQSLLVSVRAAQLTQRFPGNFMCEKSTFHNAIMLAEHGLHLASQAHPPLTNPPDVVLASILAGIQAVETKVDNLLLHMADKAADAHDKAAFAEITTSLLKLREKINRSLAKAILKQHPMGPPKVSTPSNECSGPINGPLRPKRPTHPSLSTSLTPHKPTSRSEMGCHLNTTSAEWRDPTEGSSNVRTAMILATQARHAKRKQSAPTARANTALKTVKITPHNPPA
ncbi:hypothetical protein CROQUDRAFT_87508 [Cronartium quercuum f. sp. fusiforme G11]|uniref:Uncharacterized protein n=1 Tax=Cronartium quercuum f. sp. fusiforme G11 TaxID=708437 RepID=A0A9P6NV02_9BASI|nr:hypothetical protein CROQUDRAFT_87508 [Cronartium quercuum f. sp. fusiforme G11]